MFHPARNRISGQTNNYALRLRQLAFLGDKTGTKALLTAASSADRVLLCNLKGPKTGKNAMHRAAEKGHSDIIELMRDDYDANAQDVDGNTALHLLCLNFQKNPAKYAPAIMAFIIKRPQSPAEALAMMNTFDPRDDVDLSIKNNHGEDVLTLFQAHCMTAKIENVGIKAGVKVTELLLRAASDRASFTP